MKKFALTTTFLTILPLLYLVSGQQVDTKSGHNGPFPGWRKEDDIDRICDRWVICPSGSRCVLRTVQCQDPVCPLKAECQEYSTSTRLNPGPCYQPLQLGHCSSSQYSRKWFYNVTSFRCEPFVYSGCGGNDNSFSSDEDCRRTCNRSQDICQLRPETGFCKAAFSRWYYDITTKSCKQFLFGGCLGNKNNFRTLGECQSACQNRVN